MRFISLILIICNFPHFNIAARVPDSYEIFLNPDYDIYALKHPHIEEIIDFTKYKEVREK